MVTHTVSGEGLTAPGARAAVPGRHLAEVPRLVAADRSTPHRPHGRGARATPDALAVPRHTTTNHSR